MSRSETSLFNEVESKYEGQLHIYAEELNTGKLITLRPDERVASASTIKLPILMHTAMLVDEGKVSWSDQITLKSSDKVGGMGVLRHLDDGLKITLKDACYLMTTISDNTATNLVIDHVGLQSINERIQRFGLSDTRLNRKAFSPDVGEASRFGLGVTTAREMGILMKILYQTSIYTNSPDSDALGFNPTQLPGENALLTCKNLLALQQDLVGIARVLPPDWKYAGKTGRISPLRADVGFVLAPNGSQWILSIFCYGLETENWSIQNDGLLAIAEATKIILSLNDK